MKRLSGNCRFWMLLVLGYTLCSLILVLTLIRPAQRTFAATYMTMNNPFYEVIQTQLQKGVTTHGDRLIVRDPLMDARKQAAQIEQFIVQKVDGIFVNPVDRKILEPVLGKARQAGIPVIALDTNASKETVVSSTVVSNNYEAGRLCALDLVKRQDHGKIWLLRHSSAQSADDRIRGFLSIIEQHPGFSIIGEAECEGQLEKAMPAMNALLEERTDGDVVMALNDPSALGAIAALTQHGLDNVRVYGVDGTPDMKARIAQNPLYATVAQSPINIGKMASETMYELISGHPVKSLILVDVEFLNQQRLKGRTLTGWQ